MKIDGNTVAVNRGINNEPPRFFSQEEASIEIKVFNKNSDLSGLAKNFFIFPIESIDENGEIIFFAPIISADEFLRDDISRKTVLENRMGYGNISVAMKKEKTYFYTATHIFEKFNTPIDEIKDVLKAETHGDALWFTPGSYYLEDMPQASKIDTYPDSMSVVIKGVHIHGEESVALYTIEGVAYQALKDTIMTRMSSDVYKRPTQYILKINNKYWNQIKGLSGSPVFLDGKIIGVLSMQIRIESKKIGGKKTNHLGIVLELQ